MGRMGQIGQIGQIVRTASHTSYWSYTSYLLWLVTCLLLTAAASAQDWRELPLHTSDGRLHGASYPQAIASDSLSGFLVVSDRFVFAADGLARRYCNATLLRITGEYVRDVSSVCAYSVAWSGRYYLAFGEASYARHTADGTLVDVRPYPAGLRAVSLFQGEPTTVRAASNGSRVLALLGRVNPYARVPVLFDEDGVFAGEVTLSLADGRQPEVASNGEVFALTWYTRINDFSNFPTDTRYLAIVDGAGRVIVRQQLVSNNVVGHAALVSDRQTFAVLPTASTGPRTISIYAPDGTLRRQLEITARAGNTLQVTEAFPVDGGYFVTGNGRNGVEGWFLRGPGYEPESSGLGTHMRAYATTGAMTMLLSDAGVLPVRSREEVMARGFEGRQPIVFTRPHQESGAAAALPDGGALVVWRERPELAGNILARRISQSGVPLGSAVTVATGCDNTLPAVATNGREFLAVWIGCGSLRAARLSWSGGVLDTVPLTLAASGVVNQLPSVTFNGTSYAVAWQGAGGVAVARVTTGGTLLDSPARTFDGASPVIAPGPDGFLLAYVRRFGAPNAGHVVTQRLGNDLAPSGEPQQVTAAGVDLRPWSLVRAADRYLLTFSIPSDDRGRALFGAQWLTATGGRIEMGGTALYPTVATASRFYTGIPHIIATCAGSECTLLWTIENRLHSAPMLAGGPGEVRVLAEAEGARAIHFAGTTTDPRLLIYGRWEGPAYGIYLRSTAQDRRRTVRK